VIQVAIPPLRERPEDIAPISRLLLANICGDRGIAVPALSAAVKERLAGHDWPGNVREMRNALEHALVVAERPDRLCESDLPHSIGAGQSGAPADVDERDLLLRALALADGKKAKAARALNCSRMTLYRRLERAGVDSRMIAEFG